MSISEATAFAELDAPTLTLRPSVVFRLPREPMRHHEPIVDVYYRLEVAGPDARGNFSWSPTKPRRFVERLLRSPLSAAIFSG